MEPSLNDFFDGCLERFGLLRTLDLLDAGFAPEQILRIILGPVF